MEKGPTSQEIVQKEIDQLLDQLARYIVLYDSLSPELQSKWDEVEQEGIGAEVDESLNKKEVAENLRKFLRTLEEKNKKEAN